MLSCCFCGCLAALLCVQLVLDPHPVVVSLPTHLMGCLLGYLSGVLPSGYDWAAELTECSLTDSGPLEHVVRGASVMVSFFEVIPRFR